MNPGNRRPAWRSLLVFCLVLAPAPLLAQGTPPPLDPLTAFFDGLMTVRFWGFLALVGFFGTLGGLVYELLSLGGRIERPHKTDDVDPTEKLEGAIAKYLYDLGVVGRIVIGALAAIAVVGPLNVIEKGPLGVISVSIVAGAVGIAVFRSLQNRLLAALAASELARTREQADERSVAQERIVGELDAEFEQLKKKLDKGEPLRQNKATGNSSESAPPVVPLPELDRITQKLGEARALAMAGRRFPISVRQRVHQALAGWAGVPISSASPETKEIARLWRENLNNPALADSHLETLIARLKAELLVRLPDLQPLDLNQNGRFDTIGKLVDLVEASTIGR